MAKIIIPKVQKISIDKLKTDKANPNKMSQNQLTALKKNLLRYGFIVPIITNKDGMIADGEHRLIAAKECGMTTVPVIALDVKEVDRVMLRQILNKLKGTHDPLLDATQYEEILKHGDEGLFEELSGINIKDLNKETVNIMQKELTEPEKVKQLGKHVIQCPKCEFKFERQDQ